MILQNLGEREEALRASGREGNLTEQDFGNRN